MSDQITIRDYDGNITPQGLRELADIESGWDELEPHELPEIDSDLLPNLLRRQAA